MTQMNKSKDESRTNGIPIKPPKVDIEVKNIDIGDLGSDWDPKLETGSEFEEQKLKGKSLQNT